MSAAFLCAHRRPFPHTCRQYPNDLQGTLWATTSNDELGLAADNLAPTFHEEVHKARRSDYLHAQAGAPHWMLRLRQARDTPQVPIPALAEMCLLASRKLENPPKCWVAIHRAIVQKCHSDPRCLPIPMRRMPAAIYEPSTLLKHPVKCISPRVSLVLFTLLESIRDQQGVHSPSLSEQVVSQLQVSILTTSWSSRALQSESSDVPHPVERLRIQSG